MASTFSFCLLLANRLPIKLTVIPTAVTSKKDPNKDPSELKLSAWILDLCWSCKAWSSAILVPKTMLPLSETEAMVPDDPIWLITSAISPLVSFVAGNWDWVFWPE